MSVKIVVYERWAKLDSGEVVRLRSFDGKKWMVELTPYKDKPFIEIKLVEISSL